MILSNWILEIHLYMLVLIMPTGMLLREINIVHVSGASPQKNYISFLQSGTTEESWRLMYVCIFTLASPHLLLMFSSVCHLNPVLSCYCTPYRYHLYNMFSLNTRNSFYGIKGSWHIQDLNFKNHHCRDHEKLVIKIARFMGPTWGPPRSCRPQMGPMLAPGTLRSGLKVNINYVHSFRYFM